MNKLGKIVKWLDRELKVADFKDSSNNGLQVENQSEIKRVCCGVDASMQFFEAAAERKANLLICHHGISWGDSLKRITDLNYRRLSFLMKHNMALYACHLPLDAHPRLGNNARLASLLGLKKLKPFGLYNKTHIGFSGELPKPMSLGAFKLHVSRNLRVKNLQTMSFGKTTVRTVGIISGGAADEIVEAGEKKLDVFLSGEPSLGAYSLAQEYGINAVFAGHYATEIYGVLALSVEIEKHFKVKADFIDLKIPF